MWGFAIGIAAAFIWIVLWAIVLRAAGVPVFARSPERSEVRRQHSLRMGQARYVVVEGILGPGVAFGLAMTVGDLVGRPSHGWIEAVFKFVFLALIFGAWSGCDGWVKLRGAAPFPPESLREK